MNLESMAMKGYSVFPKAPALLKTHQQIVLCHIQDLRWGILTALQRCSQCIPQPQPTGPYKEIYETLYPSSYVLNNNNFVLLQRELWHRVNLEGWYTIKQRNRTVPRLHLNQWFLTVFSFFLCGFVSLYHKHITFRGLFNAKVILVEEQ